MPVLNRKLSSTEQKSVESYNSKSNIYVAEVMDTRSPVANGDILVWILGSANDKNNPKNWVVAHSINDINTTINSKKVINDDEDFNTKQTSTGEWKPKPFIGNYVFIFYPQLQGNSNIPYYFGSLGSSSQKTMIPGIPYDLESKDNFQPICEKNYQAKNQTAFPPLANNIKTQGLEEDRLRGASTATGIRDIPSHCWGYLSPLGNSFVIDDGWSLGDKNLDWINDPRKNALDNEEKDDNGEYFTKKIWMSSLKPENTENKFNRFHGGFRFRTRSGTQLLVLDSGNIYAINSDGSAWMELSEDGYIDCYSDAGVNVGSRGDINIRTSANINIEAEGRISFRAKDFSFDAPGNMNVSCGSLLVDKQVVTKDIEADSGNIGEFYSANASMNGTFMGTLQGTAYFATYSSFTPVEQPIPKMNDTMVRNPSITKLHTVNLTDAATTQSITTRCPAHEPWKDHDKNDVIPELDISQKKAKSVENKVEAPIQTNQINKG